MSRAKHKLNKFVACLAAISVSAIAQTCPPASLVDKLNTDIAASLVLDYLIQNVCIDANNRPVTGDPAVCALSRNVKIGERVPYITSDVDRRNNGARYEGHFSYPVIGEDGALKIIAVKQLTGPGRAVIDSNFAYSFDETRDAYDLIDVSDTFVSAIRTTDPGCLDQKFSSADPATGVASKRTNGWRFMPTGALPTALGLVQHTLKIDALSPTRPAGCVGGLGLNVLAVYSPPQPIKYESGKTLMTIQTSHVADANFDNVNNAIEKFFFSREYGLTRWEAWMPQAKCIQDNPGNSICYPLEQDNRLHGLCPTKQPNADGSFSAGNALTPLPGYVVLGSTPYVRIDCRDASSYLPLNMPALPIDPTTGRRNAVLDVSWDKTTNIAP
jgi:hypothetical protein